MNQSSHLFLQTAAETDYTLSLWVDRLDSDRFFELGSDPRFLEKMEQEFDRLGKRLSDLRVHVKLGQMPVRQANSYFAALGELNKATTLIKEIRKQDFGSIAYTARCLRQLESCQQTLHEMMYLLKPSHSNRLH
jgi:hypothetical protein